MSSDEAKDALVKLEKSKVPSEVLEAAYDAAEFGAEKMIKYDKKREKIIMEGHLGKLSSHQSVELWSGPYTPDSFDNMIKMVSQKIFKNYQNYLLHFTWELQSYLDDYLTLLFTILEK